MTVAAPKLELSRPFAFADLGDRGGGAVESLTIRANADECAGLAQRFDLLSVVSFAVRVALKLDRPGDLALLQGRMQACVLQSCVASLEPVTAVIDEDFELVFCKDGHEAGEDDPPMDLAEPWPGEVLDVGEMAAQQLGLALDPYPRATVADVHAADSGQETDAGTHKPFSSLAGLRDRLTRKA